MKRYDVSFVVEGNLFISYVEVNATSRNDAVVRFLAMNIEHKYVLYVEEVAE